jgi:HD-GYP domain-containing protein (c-di-GMP phosphodiesterase class II)
VTGPQHHDVDAGDRHEDVALRRSGRSLTVAMYSALRALRLYPLENAAVQRAIADVDAVARDVLQRHHDLEFRASGDFLFLNGTRLRLELDNYASVSHLLSHFRSLDLGGFRLTEGVTPRDWTVFLSLLQSTRGVDEEARLADLEDRLGEAGVTVVQLLPPALGDVGEQDENVLSREAATRTYARSVSVTREVMTSVRMGRSPNLRRIKRAVQGIVDQILADEQSLVGLTTLRDFDEYTFTHSVNVCIFSVALGRRLGLTRLQLYDLGMAGLFHDIGKSRVPLEVLNCATGLTPEAWAELQKHPWYGALALFAMPGQQELPYRAMVVAYEHHMKIDLSGYPAPVRPRRMSIYSKIVAVADGFDAATSSRVYQVTPLAPSDVLRGMRERPQMGFDPVVVKAFLNLTGVYPIGTLVVLDTGELAIVHAVSADPKALSRPIVRIIGDSLGNVEFPGRLEDLSVEREPGVHAHTIVDTADPERYGIRISDYFV